jgi:protein phosphatase
VQDDGTRGWHRTTASFFRATAASGTGPRENNEDAGYASAHFLAVADGVGGNAGGDVASALVIDCLVQQLSAPTAEDPGGALVRAVAEAGGQLAEVSGRRPELAGMATTLTAVLTPGDGTITVAHVGDSRAYLWRAGQLHRLTRDHTLVQELVDDGQISPEEAMAHPMRSLLLAALAGRPEDVDSVEVSRFAVEPGDRLLVCSDGLTGVVPDATIARLLGEAAGPDVAAQLRDAALAAPASDNVTTVVGIVDPTGAPRDEAPTRVGASSVDLGSTGGGYRGWSTY